MFLRTRKHKSQLRTSHSGLPQAEICAYLASNQASCDASNHNPLDLIERDFVAGAIVELRRARAFVRRHELGVFERPASFEIDGDAGVTADLDVHANLGGAALDPDCSPGTWPSGRRLRRGLSYIQSRAEVQDAAIPAGRRI
jgi:hypothetical protein